MGWGGRHGAAWPGERRCRAPIARVTQRLGEQMPMPGRSPNVGRPPVFFFLLSALQSSSSLARRSSTFPASLPRAFSANARAKLAQHCSARACTRGLMFCFRYTLPAARYLVSRPAAEGWVAAMGHCPILDHRTCGSSSGPSPSRCVQSRQEHRGQAPRAQGGLAAGKRGMAKGAYSRDRLTRPPLLSLLLPLLSSLLAAHGSVHRDAGVFAAVQRPACSCIWEKAREGRRGKEACMLVGSSGFARTSERERAGYLLPPEPTDPTLHLHISSSARPFAALGGPRGQEGEKRERRTQPPPRGRPQLSALSNFIGAGVVPIC